MRKKRKRKAEPKVVQALAAGIDIGASEHWVSCPPDLEGRSKVRSFGATTVELKRLADWLAENGVESVAMESTYVYWIPLYELLEERGFEVMLVNARQLHNVPGRKTDVADCEWLRLLHSWGLLRGSFRPHETICKLRSLERQLRNLVQQRAKFVQWMQKSLDQMNVLVHRAVSDLTGKTGMGIVRAIVAGEREPERLVEFRDRRCRHSEKQFAEFLTGTWRGEHLFNLGSALTLYDSVDAQIERYEAKLLEELELLVPVECANSPVPPHPNAEKERKLRRRGQPLRAQLWRLSGVDLTRIDGISSDTARTIITEVGVDLSSFPTEKHFVSWLRLCPRTAISGGKQLGSRKRKKNGTGANRIAGALRMAAVTVGRSKTALGAAYRRVARTKGASVAVFAIARKLAVLVYRMLRFGQDYIDIGAEQYEAAYLKRRLAGLRSNAEQLGFELSPLPATAQSG